MPAIVSAAQIVRDQVSLTINGQQRVLRLVSDDARVVRGDVFAGNPTGVQLVGHFRLELCRSDRHIVSKLNVGELQIDQGNGRDHDRVIFPGDYNGDGHRYEVAFAVEYGSSNAEAYAVVGVDPATGSLVRGRFKGSQSTADRVWTVHSASGLRFSGGYLHATGYDNSFEASKHGWYDDLYRYRASQRLFVYVRKLALTHRPY